MVQFCGSLGTRPSKNRSSGNDAESLRGSCFSRPLKVGCQMETDRMYLCEVFAETISATVSLVQVRRPVKPLVDLVITSSLCFCNNLLTTNLQSWLSCKYVVGKSSSFQLKADTGLQAQTATVAIYMKWCHQARKAQLFIKQGDVSGSMIESLYSVIDNNATCNGLQLETFVAGIEKDPQ